MIKNICSCLVLVSLIFSCSSDKDGDNPETDVNAIIGTWDVTELRIDNDTASDQAKFGKQILDKLAEQDCSILTLDFKEDLSTTASNSANYLEFNIVPPIGLTVTCPEQSDTETSTYTYDGSILSVVDSEGAVVELNVSITGNEMVVNASDLEIENFDDSGVLVFVKR